ncbi:hypothetical protein L7F22_042793 [Adiantum nelumboides]|nr:hypothetical protein [Adiantum nelumboides]
MPPTENEEVVPSFAHAIDSQELEEDLDGGASFIGPSQATNDFSYFTDSIAKQRSLLASLLPRSEIGNLMVRKLTSIPRMGARLPAQMPSSMFRPPYHTFSAGLSSSMPPSCAQLQHSNPNQPRLASMPIPVNAFNARERRSTSSLTQSASRVNWRLLEVTVLIECKKAFEVREEEGEDGDHVCEHPAASAPTHLQTPPQQPSMAIGGGNSEVATIDGTLLLEELVSTFGLAAVQSIVQCVERRFGEASELKASGRTDWWKAREAALLAIGTVSDSLLEVKEECVFNVEGFLDSLLLEDLDPAGFKYPFLYGRALYVASKLSILIDERRYEQFLKAAVAGLGPNSFTPIRVCACRSLLELLQTSKIEVLRPHMEGVLTSLCNFMQEVSEETLHLTLDTLQTAIKADPQTSCAMESKLSPLVLGVWRHNISDPFVSMDALEVLEALKDTPGCLEPLVSRVLPFVGPILANPSDQAPGLVAGTVDLLNILIKKSSARVVHAIYNVAFQALIGLVLHSDDQSELQNATECLAAILQEGGETMLSWSGDSAGTMRLLLDAAARLLNPELDSSSSLFVERLISQLIHKLPGHMAPHLRDLVAALVQRMETSEIMGLRNSLILVVARLVHMSAPDVGQLLYLLVSIPTKDFPSSLEYIMSEWTKHQGEMQGAYQIKVTTTALALILSSRHSELSKMHVQGRVLQPAASGIMTRSRAKGAPEQWTQVPLPVKLLSLLVSAIAEMQEQGAVAGNEDDDWEEVEDGDDNEVEDDAYDGPDVGSEKSFGSKITGKLIESSVFKPLEDMQHLLTDEPETGDYKDDPCAFSDPINQINLVSYLSQVFKKLAADDYQYFSWLCQGLSENERALIQGAMTS